MLENLKKKSGSVTIEATISLSAFMFAIVTLLTIVNICVIQAKMSYAINTTAREISQYSYLYSLTGFNNRENETYEAGKVQTQDVEKILTNVNTVYNEIENLGQTGNQSMDNVEDILNAWDKIAESGENMSEAGSSIQTSIEKIANDPKNLLFGIAKIGLVKGFDLVKSKFIAAPLAKTMCKRHLVNEKGGDANAYLKHLGVVPSATGSYMDGLDFSESTLFPYGSSEIKINVSYDVKVIALLPIDFSFHFNQTAITHGWLAGELNFQSAKSYQKNKTLWTKSTVKERSSMIRHMVIADMLDEGYVKTTGLTDVQLYNAESNTFVMISSMNPLWSADGEKAKTLDDIDTDALKESIKRICGKMKSTTDGVETITTKSEFNGMTAKKEHDCSNASNKIVLVIPEDKGLKEKIETMIANTNTNGVTIEIIASYGNGANSTEVEENQGGSDE